MTVAKRLMEGALWGASTGVWTALPDYIGSQRTVRVVRTLGLLGTGAAYGVIAGQAIAEDEAERAEGERHLVDVREDEISLDVARAWASVPNALRPVVVAGGVAAGVGLIWGAFAVQQKLDDTLAGWAADRGVSRPYTAVGALYAALTAVAFTTTP